MREIGPARRHFVILSFISIGLFAAIAVLQGHRALAQTGGDENGAIELVDPKVLRVCADPHHLPFSNDKGEGFENKIAALLAQKLGKGLAYTYYPDSMGFIRSTLNALRCDVVIGIVQGADIVQTTNAYYRTGYVLVTKKGSDIAGVDTLADPKLKGKHLGIVAGTPPTNYLVTNGLIGTAKSYPLVVDTRVSAPAEDMMNDLRAGTIDGALLWGPLGGYLAKNSSVPMTVVPLVKETNGPQMVYRISMGVRHTDQEWKRTLNKLIAANSAEINDIIRSYGVPLLDEKDVPITR
jgi:quinoprotein dehydrogenase-associated probable ABC transporter substrate-binding protein